MILEKVKPESREDFNAFSFAGRVTLLGGSAIGIYKTMEEMNALEKTKRLSQPVLDKSKRGIVQKLMEEHYKSSLQKYDSEIEKMILKDKHNPSFGTALNAAVAADRGQTAGEVKSFGLGLGGAEELKDSKQLRILYMRMQCSDSDISREICAQTVKEYLNQIPEIKEETEFQKLAQEYGIVMEGENVWVGR